MTSIFATEERRPDDIQGRVQPPIPKSSHQRHTFDTRLLMHLAVVALVASAAFLGGGRLSSPDSQAAHQVRPGPGPGVEPAQAPEAAGPASAPEARGVAAVPSMPDQAEPVPASKPADSNSPPADAVVEALSYQAEPLADLAAPGQGEGVIVARAMASSRGGARSLDLTPTPLPSPTPLPTPAPTARKEPLKPETYKVRAGDTLLGIAASFGITPETVLWANDLGNGELLQIDQELTIPPVSGVLHRVKGGDTLLGIADLYGAEAAKIVEANQLVDPNQLPEGALLVVPGGMMRTLEPIVGLPPAPSAQELAAAPRYTVKPGDTLLSIADAFGVRASVIQVANGLLDPDKLQIGQELAIPGGRQVQAAPRAQPAPPAVQPPRATPAPARPAAPAELARPAQPPAPPAPEPEPPATGSGGDRIAAIAQGYLGYRYLWGGHSPKTGFDCSGFTWYVYKEAGINIPMHDLAGQLNAGPRISRDKLLPGDLVFFQNTYKAGLSHSGLYLGGGRFINAETEAVGVQIRSLSDPYWAARYVGASRPW